MQRVRPDDATGRFPRAYCSNSSFYQRTEGRREAINHIIILWWFFFIFAIRKSHRKRTKRNVMCNVHVTYVFTVCVSVCSKSSYATLRIRSYHAKSIRAQIVFSWLFFAFNPWVDFYSHEHNRVAGSGSQIFPFAESFRRRGKYLRRSNDQEYY